MCSKEQSVYLSLSCLSGGVVSCSKKERQRKTDRKKKTTEGKREEQKKVEKREK